jgi:hypothetical protein
MPGDPVRPKKHKLVEKDFGRAITIVGCANVHGLSLLRSLWR